MRSTKKCLKEWNATVEALGQGKQTILIRNYKTSAENFLLYPTVTYALKDGYLDSFQGKYRDFVKDNTLPKTKRDKILIKYFADVEEVIEKSVSRIPSAKNYIWTPNHVKNYMTGKTAHVWVLRVYKLKKPYLTKPSRAIKYVNLKDEVSLEGIEPVLSDSTFEKAIATIK